MEESISEMECVCAVALFREDGAVVLQHRDNKPTISAPDMWVLPGGHQDKGETMLECAHREMREETGYVADELHFLLSMVDDFDPQRKPYLLAVYWAKYDGKQPILCFEGQEACFVSLDKARQLYCSPFLFGLWELGWKRLTIGGIF